MPQPSYVYAYRGVWQFVLIASVLLIMSTIMLAMPDWSTVDNTSKF